jgi:uncharacterized membrane protein
MAAATTALSSPQVRWAVSGWILFIAENAILSENRTWIIEELGNEGYHALYGTCSTAATASIAYAYYSKIGRKAAASMVVKPRLSALAFSWICTTAGLIMASQSLPKLQVPVALQQQQPTAAEASTSVVTKPDPSSDTWKLRVRCPFDFADNSSSSSEEGGVRGLDRISRHPGLWSFALMSAGTAVLQPTLPLQLWWMGPAAVAWLGGAHTDSRYRRGMGGTMDAKYESVTSNLPLGAILTGRQGSGAFSKLLDEVKPLNALLAAGVATSFVMSRGRRGWR